MNIPIEAIFAMLPEDVQDLHDRRGRLSFAKDDFGKTAPHSTIDVDLRVFCGGGLRLSQRQHPVDDRIGIQRTRLQLFEKVANNVGVHSNGSRRTEVPCHGFAFGSDGTQFRADTLFEPETDRVTMS